MPFPFLEKVTFTDFPSFVKSLLKVDVNDYFENFVMQTSPVLSQQAKTSRNVFTV
jgi:hypothetical protein